MEIGNSLKERLKFLIKDAGFYGSLRAATKALSIFTFPILARIFSKEEYGLVDGIAIFASIFGPLIIMGQDSAIARYFYETNDTKTRCQIVSTGFWIEMVLAFIITGTLFFHAEFIMHTVLKSTQYTYAYRIAVLSLPFTVLHQFGLNLMKWTFQRKQYLVLTIGISITTIVLTLILVLVFRVGIIGVFWSNLLSNCIFSLFALFFCRKYLTILSSFKYLVPLAKFGYPYMLIGIGFAIFPSVDRYFIANYLTLTDLGTYAVALKIMIFVSLPVTAFRTAWSPFAYFIHKQPDAGNTYSKILTYYTFAGVLGILIVLLIGQPVMTLMASKKYEVSAVVMALLAFFVILNGSYYITGIGVGLSKKTIFSAMSYYGGIGVSVLANFLLVPRLGIMGAALGTALGQLSAVVFITIAAQRLYPIPYDFKRCILILSLGVMTAWGISAVDVDSQVTCFTAKSAMIGLFISLNFYFIFETFERRKIYGLVSKYLARLTGRQIEIS
ncbi:MAG TPA: hypothetical protein ENH85_14145 [Candidatus Scalindua sp.]|nr:hypothetical protein [Candidatus Scalindua sp.]